MEGASEFDQVPVPPSGAEAGGMLGTILGWARRVNRWLHWVAGATVIGLMLLTVVDIVGRRFFNSPFRGTVELTQLAMVVMIYLGFAYAENHGDHIAVDIVYTRLRRGVQLALTAVTSLFGIAVIALLAHRLYLYAGILAGGGYTTPTRGISQAPFALIAVGGAALFAVALIDGAIGALLRFRERT